MPVLTEDEYRDLDKVLPKLAECDLGTWDRNFVEDITRRFVQWGDMLVITPKQWEQIERMKEQYL